MGSSVRSGAFASPAPSAQRKGSPHPVTISELRMPSGKTDTFVSMSGYGGGHVKKRISLGALLAIVGVLALVAAGCGGSSNKSSSTGGGGGGGVTALPASSCNSMQYKGSGKPDYLIAPDPPLIGG